MSALGYAAVAFVYGYAKAWLLEARRASDEPIGYQLLWVLREELEFRYAVERKLLPLAGVSAETARLVTSGAFAAVHDGNALRFADAFAGGWLYSKAYDEGGLVGAVAAHGAHNFAVHLGARA